MRLPSRLMLALGTPLKCSSTDMRRKFRERQESLNARTSHNLQASAARAEQRDAEHRFDNIDPESINVYQGKNR